MVGQLVRASRRGPEGRYPASQDELVKHATKAGADDDVLNTSQALPDRTFDGPNAASQAYAEGDDVLRAALIHGRRDTRYEGTASW
jgi:hypothetical protein